MNKKIIFTVFLLYYIFGTIQAQDAINLINNGQRHMKEGRFYEAILSFSHALSLSSNSGNRGANNRRANRLLEEAKEGLSVQVLQEIQQAFDENRFNQMLMQPHIRMAISLEDSRVITLVQNLQAIQQEEREAQLQQQREAREAQAQREREEREEQAQRQREEQARIERRGHVRIWSAYAGNILVNGNETEFTVEAWNEIDITIENARGNEYSLAVRGTDGRNHQADSRITIERVGPSTIRERRDQNNRIVSGPIYTALILNPNPSPNSPDDFDFRQNAQGGITITGYRGMRRQLVIPETISDIRVTEILGGTAVGSGVFKDKNLYTVVIPNSVTSIGFESFSDNFIKKINLPTSINNIGHNAFANNQIKELNLPASLRSIFDLAFANNEIESLIIPNGITRFGYNSFRDNPITNVTIPSSWSGYSGNNFSILAGGGIFGDNRNPIGITSITLPANVPEGIIIFNFGRDFNDFYQSQGRRAGNYRFSNRIWTVR